MTGRDSVAAMAIMTRTLGRTGADVTILGYGAMELRGRPRGPEIADEDAGRILNAVLDSGINIIDTSPDYGRSEELMGRYIGHRRDEYFLASKCGCPLELAPDAVPPYTHDWSAANIRAGIERSLERLQTDHLDLLQFHEIIRMSDPGRIFASGGAMEAAIKARNAGQVRYIGFTGHKDPHIHLKMLDVARMHDFRFDAVQMPLNVMDAHYQSFQQLVLPVLIADGTGVLAMKPMGNVFILESKTVSAIECLHYAMNLPVSVVITGCDSLPILRQAVEAAHCFQPMTQAQAAVLLAKTADAASAGRYELYKTTHYFDGTWKNPQWLG
jgi:aryl-alcohol dehydrogenase-like predicted oxidoreductase